MEATARGERTFDELELRQALFDAIGEGVYVIDRDGRLVMMNAVAEELLGWSQDALAGRSVHEAIHWRRQDASSFPAEQCRLLAVARTGEPLREDDDMFVRRDGTQLPVAYSSYPLRRDGSLVGAVVVFRDITAFKLREEEEHRARLRAEVLARASALPASMRPEVGAETLLRAIAPGLADCAMIHGVRSDGIRLVALSHVDPAQEAVLRGLYERYPPDPGARAGVAAVVRSGRAEVHLEVDEGLWREIAHDSEHLRRLKALGVKSVMYLPLTALGQTFGVLTLWSLRGPYSADTLQLATQVAAQAALLLNNARLFAERTRAVEDLQRGLLPSALPDVPGLELAARYRPAGRDVAVGGDFYDVFCLQDSSCRLLIGDVSGKGAKAAAVTGLIRFIVAGAARAGGDDPLVLTLANQELLRQASLGEFCTAIYGSLTRADGRVRLRLSSAGHLPPLVLGTDGGLRELTAHGPALGISSSARWPSIDAELAPGELLLLYTDGAVELWREAPLEGERQLRELLRGCAGRPAAEILERIEHHVLLMSGGEPRDDLALLAVRADT